MFNKVIPANIGSAIVNIICSRKLPTSLNPMRWCTT